MRAGEGPYGPQDATIPRVTLPAPPGPQSLPRPPGPVSPPPGPPGAGRRPRRSWPTWWILPYLGGAAVVLAVFAILQGTVLSGPAGQPAPASTVLKPAQAFPDALFRQLSTDLSKHDKSDFLSHVAPGARPAVQGWWDNLNAIGFTTGLIMPTNQYDQVNLDRNGDGSTVVLAGTHNGLDPNANSKRPDVPLDRYQLRLHFASARSTGQITGWKPLDNAPWDGGKLYVRKSENVVVAGPAADSSLVDETLPLAQAAAAYDVGLINHVHNTDIRQGGFVAFVASDPAVRSRWFAAVKQPPAWPPASTTSASGLTVQLPGPAKSADSTWNLGGVASDSTGGARVIVTPFEDQNGATRQDETSELVGRFALDILSAQNQDLFGTSAAVPAWAIEGFAVAFEAAYQSNGDPALDTYSFTALADAVKALPDSYKHGDVPSADDLYNASDQVQQAWRVIAASVYAYIAAQHGMGQLLASAELMWTNEPDPRGNVLKSSTGETFVLYGKDTIQAGWEAYLKSPAASAPAIGPSGA